MAPVHIHGGEHAGIFRGAGGLAPIRDVTARAHGYGVGLEPMSPPARALRYIAIAQSPWRRVHRDVHVRIREMTRLPKAINIVSTGVLVLLGHRSSCYNRRCLPSALLAMKTTRLLKFDLKTALTPYITGLNIIAERIQRSFYRCHIDDNRCHIDDNRCFRNDNRCHYDVRRCHYDVVSMTIDVASMSIDVFMMSFKTDLTL